jgi:hypothetical protein
MNGIEEDTFCFKLELTVVIKRTSFDDITLKNGYTNNLIKVNCLPPNDIS